jgi:flagellar assembly protein FliH
MTATAKFLFDLDFGGGGTKPMMPVADHNAKLAQAEQIAYRNGYSAAEAKAAIEADRSLAAAVTTAATALDRLCRNLSALEARLESEAVDVAVAVVRKLTPELSAREPLAELSALASECFRHLVGAPHVAVRVNDALYEQARERLTGIAKERGFEGRLVVLADPAVAAGDCRIDWADGGMIRDSAAIDAAISELVARYLSARRSGSAPPPASPNVSGRVTS